VTTGADLLDLSPVMPVVVIADADDAVPTARALLARSRHQNTRSRPETLEPRSWSRRDAPIASSTRRSTPACRSCPARAPFPKRCDWPSGG
jgi:hypothetical protein